MTILAKANAKTTENNGSDSSHAYSAKKSKWFSAIAIVSALIFVLLNILPGGIQQFTDSSNKKNTADTSVSKLKRFVQTSSYESDQFGPWPWWVARAYFSTPTPDIVAMGDSQINAAFIQADAIVTNQSKDCVTDRGCIALKQALQRLDKTHNADNLHLVNLAMGGAMPSDYYLMSKSFFTKEQHPKIVILSLSPRSFLDATLSSASTTETFQFLSTYVDWGNLVDYAFSNPVEKYFWLIKNQLTVFKYRQDITLASHTFIRQFFNSIQNSTLNTYADILANRLTMPAIYGGNGFVAIGSNVVTPNPHVPFKGNKLEYEKRFSHLNYQTLTAQSTYFLATLKFLNNLGIEVVVVDMPMLSPVRDLLPAFFWNNYSAQLKKDCQANGAHWLDLSNDKQFSQADFLDYVHLNAYGGKKFVDRLATLLQETYH